MTDNVHGGMYHNYIRHSFFHPSLCADIKASEASEASGEKVIICTHVTSGSFFAFVGGIEFTDVNYLIFFSHAFSVLSTTGESLYRYPNFHSTPLC